MDVGRPSLHPEGKTEHYHWKICQEWVGQTVNKCKNFIGKSNYIIILNINSLNIPIKKQTLLHYTKKSKNQL